MNKNWILAALFACSACACQAKKDTTPAQPPKDSCPPKQEQAAPASGGCCEAPKSQTAPAAESVKASAPEGEVTKAAVDEKK